MAIVQDRFPTETFQSKMDGVRIFLAFLKVFLGEWFSKK
jgi:hypothetical protein